MNRKKNAGSIIRAISSLFLIVLVAQIFPNLTSSSGQANSQFQGSWENPWTFNTLQEDGRVNSTFFSFPKVIWNGSAYVDHVYLPSDFCAGIGSVFLQTLPTHTIFFEPEQKNESIGKESWTLQRFDKENGAWDDDVPVINNLDTFMNSSGIYFSRKTTLQSGSSLTEWYWLKPGSKMKILVTLDAITSGEYRLVWNLDGIYAEKMRQLDTTQDVSAKTIANKDNYWLEFISENKTKCFIDWSDTYSFDETDGGWKTSFQKVEVATDSLTNQSSARIFFGNFSLNAGESFILDPTISTFNSNPALDGYIQRYGSSYPPPSPGFAYTSGSIMKVGQEAQRISGTTYYYQWRSYISFETFSISALAYNLSATLKLKTVSGTDMDFNVSIMGGDQPIYNNVLNTSAWDSGKIEAARWDTINYPGDGVYVNLTIPVGQINRINTTEFELKSDREGKTPMLYTLESIQLYSGDSVGNEPKLEVSYNIDNPVTINGTTWLRRNTTGNKAVVVLFGAWPYQNDLYLRSIDLVNVSSPEKSVQKIAFLDALAQNGFTIFTPKNSSNTDYGLGGGPYYTYYNSASSWLEEATLWIMNQGYQRLFIFGFSGGGVVAAREIQKDYSTRLSAATVSCAPVNWAGHGLIYHSALTANTAKAPTIFPEAINDMFDFHEQMELYYNNTLSALDKEWHDWNGGHDFFSQTCSQYPYENASDVVINWYNAAHPPSTPFTPSGAATANPFQSYSYSTGAFDANGDNVKYEFSWGDGTTNQTGFVCSGTNSTFSHSWNNVGTYNVTARAQDSNGQWSPWSQNLTVTVEAAMKTTTNGTFYVPNVSASRLKIERLFSNSNLTGDQVGAQMSDYPFQFPDGAVNGSDVSFVDNATGFSEGEGGWQYMADINADGTIDIYDLVPIAVNYGRSGTYSTDLTGVTVTFDVGGEKSPDEYGFVDIPQNATTFTVKCNGTTIGAMIIFLAP
jgi:hypothetical protein